MGYIMRVLSEWCIGTMIVQKLAIWHLRHSINFVFIDIALELITVLLCHYLYAIEAWSLINHWHRQARNELS